MILAASAILQACEQVPQGQGGEPPTAREDQAEAARLREFVDLLHREIEQLHRDKERLTEEIERLQRENAALQAGTGGKPPAAARPAARPARGAPPG
jgi:predicted RNase H-like nuclease (RuvC/YqgF family)